MSLRNSRNSSSCKEISQIFSIFVVIIWLILRHPNSVAGIWRLSNGKIRSRRWLCASIFSPVVCVSVFKSENYRGIRILFCRNTRPSFSSTDASGMGMRVAGISGCLSPMSGSGREDRAQCCPRYSLRDRVESSRIASYTCMGVRNQDCCTARWVS